MTNMRNLLPKNAFGCPYLLLAPMEGVGDRTFRKAMASVGGFDEACTEFIRVPKNAHIPSLSAQYCTGDTAPIPQAAQIMGSEPQLMAAMTRALEQKGAHRVELNCGCPSNTVTGGGAGSSLLKTPQLLFDIAHAMVQAVNIPVTIKLRSGFLDTSLFKENLLAAQESGVAYITLHPRTKIEGYLPPARWDLIAEAKELLHIPVVGNGDILTVSHALKVLEVTKCDALMIGRGAIMNPWLFHEIKAHFAGTEFRRTWSELESYFKAYVSHLEQRSLGIQIGKLKQIMSFFFKGTDTLLALRSTVLRDNYTDPDDFLKKVLQLIKPDQDS
jgi:tRNA-dihydrouridine synthase C